MVTKESCQKKIENILNTNIDAKSNGGKLITQARGTDATDCIKSFGGAKNVTDFISRYKIPTNIETTKTLNTTKTNTGTKTINKATITGTKSSIGVMENFYNNVSNSSFTELGYTSLQIIVGIAVILFLIKAIKYLTEFLYDVLNAKRIVYLRILQPRGDTKIDREREKEIAKDMKEKIGRIAQVFDNIHKLGDVSFFDNIMHYFFNKPKVTLILHYENGSLLFIVGTYPEYQKLIEGAISAQYSEASIETIVKPTFFKNTYSEITILEPQKDPVYPIKLFKLMQDDPLNNISDGIGKVSSEDTFSLIIPVKPVIGGAFNKKAKFFADALYKKQLSKIETTPFWKYLIMPRKLIDFLISGPSKELIQMGQDDDKEVGMVRMLKAQEESINAMGEEAGKHAFDCGVIMVSSSNVNGRAKENLNNMKGIFTIFRDEYGNELDENNFFADVLGFIFKPLRRFAAQFHLPQFFFKKNIFTSNALGTLYHFPDGVFNRSPIIKWMDYKVLSCPDNLPVMKEDTGYVISGIIAEEYKKGILSDILEGRNHRAIGKKDEKIEELIPYEEYKNSDINEKEIVEKDGKKFVKTEKKVQKNGFKVFKDGTLLGVNVFRNQFSPVYIKKNDRTRHHYIIGKSGGGKSVFIGSLARQDVWANNGICVIDPHGDLVEDILEYIPKERAKDVIFFDAGNETRPMGLNLYEIDNIDQADRVVNDATEIFIKMFGSEIFGPRIQEYFKYGSLTLLEDFEDRPTLLDVPRLFTDETYREYKTKKVTNAVVKNFREKTYNAMGDREKQEIIPYFTSKFVSFNTNRLIRNIIGQTKSGFKFREAMDSGKILLVNLSKGKIGEINAQLLGMILVSQIYNAAMSRANIPEKERRDFYLYVDEFQNFVSGTFADILSEARKYRLSLIMAHQYIAQLETGKAGGEGGKSDVKAAVFGNVGTMQSFKVGAPDAEFLEKEYAPVLSAQDIVGISNYKVYIKMNINNASTRVFSMDAIGTSDYKNPKIAAILKEYSAKKYGRAREYVDAEIIARLGLGGEENNENQTENTETT